MFVTISISFKNTHIFYINYVLTLFFTVVSVRKPIYILNTTVKQEFIN